MLSWTIRFWKQTLVALTLLCAFFCFLQSDLVTAAGIMRYLQALYFSLSLFILGALDIGFPPDASTIADLLLWICYFLAPLLTAGFLYVFVQERLLKNLSPRYRHHTVICGLGRSGKLVFELAKANYSKKNKIVIIEANPDNPHGTEIENDPAVWWIRGDFTDKLILKKARAHQAREIIITTNNDFANLKALFTLEPMLAPGRVPRIFCHIGDPKLLATFKDPLLDETLLNQVHFFNAYDEVTRRLARNWLQDRAEEPHPRTFILVGLGRFGRLLLQNILADPELTEEDEIAIVTIQQCYDIARLKHDWPAGLNQRPRLHEPIIANASDPAVWDQLNSMLSGRNNKVYLILCRDDDIANLETAITLKTGPASPLQQATVICRIFSKTVKAMSDVLEHKITRHEQRDLLLFPFQDELKEAFREEIFHPDSSREAGDSD